MRNCTFIDPLVTPYVDGELSATERTFVEDHLNQCPPCCARVAAEGAVRDLVRARRPGLTAERASESLRSQCRDVAARTVARSPQSGVPASSPPARAARA